MGSLDIKHIPSMSVKWDQNFSDAHDNPLIPRHESKCKGLHTLKNVIIMSPSFSLLDFDLSWRHHRNIFVSMQTLTFLFHDKGWEDGHECQRGFDLALVFTLLLTLFVPLIYSYFSWTLRYHEETTLWFSYFKISLFI